MDNKYHIRIELKSDTLAASGEGFGAVIDNDVVFDDFGIPYIPAKRIKGCLRQAADEVKNMFKQAEIDPKPDIEAVFGKQGNKESAPVYFHNLYIEDYEDNREWLNYYLNEDRFKNILSRESILECFTTIRQQTAINTHGVALDHALHTSRILRSGNGFTGEVGILNEDESIINTLALACRNLRYIGTRRNRGFGKVVCEMLKNGKAIKVELLEGQTS